MNYFLFAQAVAPNTPVPPKGVGVEAVERLRTLKLAELKQEHWFYLGEHYGSRALFVLVLMVLAWTISGWLSTVVQKGLTRVRFDVTLTLFLSRLVRWGILFLTGLSCLSYFGIETTSFAAVIGAAGLAIGLAFQGTLSNFAAGAMLLIFRPYKVGDTVNAANYLGKVAEIALFTTEVDTLDGRRVIIPNSSIYGAVIENVTYHPVRRVDVPVGVSYDADVDATRRVLERALTMVPQAIREPAAEVVLVGLGGSSVDWSVRVWTTQVDFGAAKQALIRAVKLELDQAGIGIPFPQMDVHFFRAGQQKAA
jgi:small conductance mechanosensitive channel